MTTTSLVDRKTMRQLCDILFNHFRDATQIFIVIDPSFKCSQSNDQFYFIVQVSHIKLIHKNLYPNRPQDGELTILDYSALTRMFKSHHIELKLSRKSFLAKSVSQLNAVRVIIVDNQLIGDKGKEFYSHTLAPLREGNEHYSAEVHKYYDTMVSAPDETLESNINMYDIVFGTQVQPSLIKPATSDLDQQVTIRIAQLPNVPAPIVTEESSEPEYVKDVCKAFQLCDYYNPQNEPRWH